MLLSAIDNDKRDLDFADGWTLVKVSFLIVEVMLELVVGALGFDGMLP
jgi:hypothetical protein